MKKRIIKIISSILVCFATMSFSSPKSFKNHEITKENEYSVVILGGGIGALTSGIYLARAGYKPIIIEGELPGGLITQSHAVENWPGKVNIAGVDLVDKIKEQALKNGCIILSKEVIGVDFSKEPFVITLQDLYRQDKVEKIRASSCIIAMGTSSNYLNVPGEQNYWGRGVSNCAVCDGSFYKNKKVAIIGGGDAAILEANYLSKLANKVTVLVRKNKLRANDNQKVKALSEKKNIEIIYNTNVVAINGDKEQVQSIKVFDNKKNKYYSIDVDGVFLAIGSKPNTKIFQKKLALDKKGYIQVDNQMQTSTKGVYAIGDIVDPVYKQAITAAGDGAKAAISCQKLLETMEIQNILKVDTFVAKEASYSTGVVEIKDKAQFEKEMSSSTVPVIVDFYASWCRPCKRLAPLLEDKAKRLSGKVKVLKVNVERLRDISSKYQIRAMPTIIVFDKDKKMLFKKMGQNSISNLFISLEKLKHKTVDEIDGFLQDVE